MDLSPSPFWIKNKHTLVFDFTNVSNERCNDDDVNDNTPEHNLIGNHSLILVTSSFVFCRKKNQKPYDYKIMSLT